MPLSVLSLRGRLVAVLFVIPAVLSARAAPPDADHAAVPGRNLGRVRLGMTREAVRKLLGRPHVSYRVARTDNKTLKRTPVPYETDVWRSSGDSDPRILTVVIQAGKVVQIEANSPAFVTPDGVGVGTSFAAIRRKHPGMTATPYLLHDPQMDAGSAYVQYAVDDVKRGIAFTVGTQDDEGLARELPKLKPNSLIIHEPGRPALPIEDSDYGSVSPGSDNGKWSRKIQGYFAAG